MILNIGPYQDKVRILIALLAGARLKNVGHFSFISSNYISNIASFQCYLGIKGYFFYKEKQCREWFQRHDSLLRQTFRFSSYFVLLKEC